MPAEKNCPIILGGCYRSGTTLLRNIVNSHPNIYCGPEVKFFEDFYGTFLNDPLKHKRFFRTVSSMNVPKGRVLTIFGNAYLKTIRLSAKNEKKVRWAEKNPENVLYMKEWNFLLKGNFKYVFIVRHPLDTLASLVEIGFNKSLPKGFDAKLEIVNNFISKGYKYYLKNQENSYMIKYEDVTSSPDEELKKLFAFLGEEYDATILDKVFSNNKKAGIGDPKFKKTSSIHSNSTERWKKDLKKSQLKQALKTMKPLIKKLDYSI